MTFGGPSQKWLRGLDPAQRAGVLRRPWLRPRPQRTAQGAPSSGELPTGQTSFARIAEWLADTAASFQRQTTGRRTRTVPLRLLGVVLVLATTAIAAGPVAIGQVLPPGGTFWDDDGNPHEGNIEAIAAQGITRGCNPPDNDRFCPDDPVTRGQMAAFLSRTLDLAPATKDYFTDDEGSIFEDDINRLSEAAITRGCNPSGDRFCPRDQVTRAQMAAFLVRSHGYDEESGVDHFTDDQGSIFEDDINRLAAAGITKGCTSDRFCPDDPVLRDQMASFLARARGLSAVTPAPRCSVFPVDNVWNRRVEDLAVHPRSADYVAAIGTTSAVHADFGSGLWPPGSNSPIGIPYVEVGGDQPEAEVIFTDYGDESDPGPYRIPSDAPIEGGPDASGDRHVLAIDRDGCFLYELFHAFPQPDGSWEASSGAIYDLSSNALRPNGWTSADAAGLPIFPGLVRYEEVAAGRISHAIRFTAPSTQSTHVWPARHDASARADLNFPPMGQRFRLKASFDISRFSQDVRVILQAFQEYGIVLADNGAAWFVSGAPDSRWDNDLLRELHQVPGSAFEAVSLDTLMIDPDSGAARPWAGKDR